MWYILVIFYYISGTPTLSDLKTIHLLSQVLWVNDPGKAYLSSLLQGLSQGSNFGVSWGWLQFHTKAWLGKNQFVCSFIYLLSGFSSLRHVRRRSWIPCWLMARGHPFIPCLLGLPNTAACFIKVRRESANQTEVTTVCKLVMEMTSYHLSLTLWFRNKSLSPAYTQEKK